jgi:hypothetical protein
MQLYFNQLQAHSKNLKCVGLTPPRAGFVFEIVVSQSNILVSSAGQMTASSADAPRMRTLAMIAL